MALWLLSLSCSGPGPLFANQVAALEWIIYILFSPCAHHILQAAFHVLFFSTLTIFQLQLLASKKGPIINRQASEPNKPPVSVLVGPLFIITLSLLTLVTLLSFASLAWYTWYACASSGWTSTPCITEVVFGAIQAFAWTRITWVVAHELPRQSLKHPRPLRAWWFAISLLSILQFASAIVRIAGHGFSYTISLRVDDIVNILIFPISLFLLVVSVKGETGLRQQAQNDLHEPLLSEEVDGKENTNFTGYYKADLFGRAFWLWLNPVLSKGAKTTLQIEDIPELSPDDKAKRLYSLFRSNWPINQSNHPTRTALIRSFNWQFAFNGFLAFCKAISMYVGPLLIQSFSSFLESSPRYPAEGYVLVFILLVAKLVEVLSTQHYQFLSLKLGMTIRSCLITSIYRKGLRLSNSARQSHGAGQIVNYMTVDVQQINDSVVQIHNTWMLPVQLVFALFILYRAIGVATFAGLAVIIVVGALIANNSRLLKKYSLEIMMKKDVRMKATTEVLNYMKIIKLQAWEDYFQKKVEDCRKAEYKSLTKFQYALAFNISVLTMSTSIVSIVSFGVCMLLNLNFTAAKAFTVISTFNILADPVRTFPQAIILVSQALVSLDRLDKYFLSDELAGYVKRDSHSEPGVFVRVQKGIFTWDEKELTPNLRDINFEAPQGHLVAIVGMVGAGKSSLLAALLGEMPKLNGNVEVYGTTAYVPQTAWIQSGTVQENILFGLQMDQAKYQRTLKVCALEPDIAIFEFGDQTEIGERGINLSGGQKQRIQLARAVYQDSDVYFLDDIFSAVDAHTGSALFKDCLLGALDGKTRVLVTHQVEFLHKADLILVVQNGVIAQSGKYADLLKEGTEFAALVAAHQQAIGAVDGEPEQVEIWTGTPDGEFGEMLDKGLKLTKQLSLSRSQERLKKGRSSESFSKETRKELVPGRLVEDEKRETGKVGWDVYWLFLTSAFGAAYVVLVLLVQIIAQSFSISGNFWLSHETAEASFDAALFMIVYVLLCAGNWLFSITWTILLALFSLRSSQKFYLEMLKSIFRARMSFFDTTPTGRILARSSTDQAALDTMLPISMGFAMLLYFSAVGIVVVTCAVTWPVICVIVPLGFVYVRYQAFYIRSSREIARLDSVTKAPVIHHFTETIAGFMVIRGFKKEDQFINTNLDCVNTNLKMDFHSSAASNWLGCRLELVGSIVLCTAALMLVAFPSGLITASSAALSLSYSMSLNAILASSIFFGCMIENKMVSVERIRQYIRLPREAALTIVGSVPHEDWPHRGNISIRNLKVRYQPTMPLVLRGINLDIAGRQKIGVVGRTGSGKSTLIQVMFRIIEPAGGSISFDEVDIASIGLHDLRSRLGIIPQDPVLFEGTVRTNMDPLNIYKDDAIWEGLRKCQLEDIVRTRADKLDAVVTESGENWSVGQRQLLCLGRTLLKQSHILFLDEATASVDAQTDAVLQKVIREEFRSSTVISIAHRIPSVMDCDMVMVLEAGIVKEYDSPLKLLGNSCTLFAALVQEYSARSRGSGIMKGTCTNPESKCISDHMF